MKECSIGAVGIFGKNSEPQLEECKNKFAEKGIQLYHEDISGHCFNAALDFVDIDSIMIAAIPIFQQFMISGMYDFIKSQLVALWSIMRNSTKRMSKIPFSIKVSKIPTPAGNKNITFKIVGELTDEQKDMVIEKAFETVQKISEGTIQLMALTKAHEAFGGGNLLNIDPQSLEVSEIDIEAEIRKKTQE